MNKGTILQLGGQTDGEAVVTAVAVLAIEIVRVEAHAVRIRGTLRSRRPIVAVGADIIDGQTIAVARGRQEVTNA